MFYFLYKTTNNINNKFYIGKHTTSNINDGYLGSGKLLLKAIKKYGSSNFTREILCFYENDNDLNVAEKLLVTLDLVKSADCYNAAVGGQGGNIVIVEGHPKRDATLAKIKKSKSTKEYKDKQSEIAKTNHINKRIGMYGKKQSAFQKKRVSDVQTNRIRTEEENLKRLQSLKKTLTDPDFVHPNKGRKMPGDNARHFRKYQSMTHVCPNCGTTMKGPNYFRYHGDKCKNNK